MPTPDMGLSFSPGQSMDRQRTGANGSPNSNVQQAIRTLSLRLPSIVGAKAIGPQSLLSGQGGVQGLSGGIQMGAQGMPGGLDQILKMLLGGGSPQSMMGQGGDMGAAKSIPGNGGSVGPNFKFGTNGNFGPFEPIPGSFDPITTESDNATYSKPETNFGQTGNGTTLPPVGDNANAVYRRQMPTKFLPGE